VHTHTHTQTKSEGPSIMIDVDGVGKPKLFDRSKCENRIFRGRSSYFYFFSGSVKAYLVFV
jgi:hypothetical protein